MQRIQAILQVMTPCQILIDIGCDHGYLGIASLQQQLTETVWNVDLNPLPLAVAQVNFAKYQLTDRAQFFLSNGFEQLPRTIGGKTATVVCSGMGTNLIITILNQLPDYVNQIICLPHTLARKLRYWAQKNHFYVLNEQYVRAKHKVYELLVFNKDPNLSQLQYRTPQDFLMGLKKFWNNCSNEFKDYWKNQQKQINKIPIDRLTSDHYQQLDLINQILNNPNDN